MDKEEGQRSMYVLSFDRFASFQARDFDLTDEGTEISSLTRFSASEPQDLPLSTRAGRTLADSQPTVEEEPEHATSYSTADQFRRGEVKRLSSLIRPRRSRRDALWQIRSIINLYESSAAMIRYQTREKVMILWVRSVTEYHHH